MRHEPRRLVSNVQHSVKLVRAHALLRRAEKEDRHEPFANWDVRVFKDGSNRDRELLPARSALVKPLAGGSLAVGLRCDRVNRLGLFSRPVLAVRTDRAIRPTKRFQQFPRFVVVPVLLGQRNKGDFLGTECAGRVFHGATLRSELRFVKYIITDRPELSTTVR